MQKNIEKCREMFALGALKTGRRPMLPGIQCGCEKGFAHQPEGLWFMFPTLGQEDGA